MKRPTPVYDFRTFGQAIKAARKSHNESRNTVGRELFISPRYLANIENKGQHPSLQVFFGLITRYHISVDQFLFADEPIEKDTRRRQPRRKWWSLNLRLNDDFINGAVKKRADISSAFHSPGFCGEK